ncbi:MAG TPA: hypothetical protein ENI55_03555, partial [Alphaproteobacteria bacterium]|nr:hypothetical protein [Alphaproteobacteria bacterium]
MSEPEIKKLLEGPLKVVNIGLREFALELGKQGVEAVNVDWSPPAGGNPDLAGLSAKLLGDRGGCIEAANRQALRRLLSGDPVLVDVIPAADAIAGLKDRMILHAGPPIDWDHMCGPMRGAV